MTAPFAVPSLPAAPDRYDRADQDRVRADISNALLENARRANVAYIDTDRGDANVTLDPQNDLEVQRFATELTANRTVTLAGGFAGAKFRVVRTGLGAFTLDVGGLKTLPASTAAWADVGHDGSGWILTGYGVL